MTHTPYGWKTAHKKNVTFKFLNRKTEASLMLNLLLCFNESCSEVMHFVEIVDSVLYVQFLF